MEETKLEALYERLRPLFYTMTHRELFDDLIEYLPDSPWDEDSVFHPTEQSERQVRRWLFHRHNQDRHNQDISQ